MTTNAEVAALHTRRVIGPTILMGDGSYFDFESPETSEMTIEDYAWALAGTVRFRAQTRARLRRDARCFYSVAEHCCRMAAQMLSDGHGTELAYDALMHEGGEVPWGDIAGPAKPMVPSFKEEEKRCERASFAIWGVTMSNPDLIKRYDLRMLATEKRDLMPQGSGDQWAWIKGYEPFASAIIPWPLEEAADAFLGWYRQLAPKGLAA
jgi:hypothetical protein